MPNGKGSIYLELIVLASGSSSLIWPKICMAWCPLWSQNVLKVGLFEIRIDWKMFVNSSVPHIEKMKLANVNRKSNYHIYIHTSFKFSASITKLTIALLNVSVKRPGLCSCHSNSCMSGSESARKSGSYQLYLIILSMLKW